VRKQPTRLSLLPLCLLQKAASSSSEMVQLAVALLSVVIVVYGAYSSAIIRSL